MIFKLKKEFKKIAESFKRKDDILLELKEEIKDIKNQILSKKEIELMIRESLLDFREHIPRTPRTSPMRKKANKILDKVEVMQEIASHLQNGLSTTEMYKLIVKEKKLCKKTCFYNYLNKVRKNFPRTPRTKFAN